MLVFVGSYTVLLVVCLLDVPFLGIHLLEIDQRDNVAENCGGHPASQARYIKGSLVAKGRKDQQRQNIDI